MAFHVGQPVECIDVSRGVEREGLRLKKYIVSAISPCRKFIGVDGMTVKGDPAPWFATRFRPLTDRKSEVSFTRGADPSSERYDNRRKQKERV